jgi:hypothetical protein
LLSNGGKVERGQDLKIMDNWQSDENGSPQDPLRQVILTKERKKTCNLHLRTLVWGLLFIDLLL